MLTSPYGHRLTKSTSANGVAVPLAAYSGVCVDYASTANIADLSAASTTMDGATLVEGKVVLLKNQSTTSQNGLYVVDSVSGVTCSLVRMHGFEAGESIAPGFEFRVMNGTANGGLAFKLAGTADLAIGTSALTFEAAPDTTDLASTANGKGASLVGIEDSGTLITATTVEGALAELAGRLGAVTKMQLATGTLVAGEAVINTGIVVTASSRAIPIPSAALSGTTNLAALAHLIASNVVGGAGVGSITIQALGDDGAKDSDAAGAFFVLILN